MKTFKRILVLDDCATIRMILKVYLMNLGAEVVEASDGQTALAMLRDSPADLVIADVRMSPMDGIDFVRAIRDDLSLELRATPVILLTGDQEAALKDRGIAAGANAFVHKPISPSALMAAIEAVGMSAAA